MDRVGREGVKVAQVSGCPRWWVAVSREEEQRPWTGLGGGEQVEVEVGRERATHYYYYYCYCYYY